MRKRIIMTATGLSMGRMLTFAVVYKPHVSSLSNTEMVLAAAEEIPARTIVDTTRMLNEDFLSGGTVESDFGDDINNLLGYAAYFHIFARKAIADAHVNGNLAVQELDSEGHSFGTKVTDKNNLDTDIFYIQTLKECNGGSFVARKEGRTNKAVFGKDVRLENISNEVHLNGKKVGNIHVEDVFQDKGNNTYLDFDSIFGFLNEQSKKFPKMTSYPEVRNSNFSDRNSRTITLSDYEPNSKNEIVINLAPEVLSMDTRLVIDGLNHEKDGTNVIINVDTGGADPYDVKSQIQLKYTNGDMRGNKETDHFDDSHLLWNFYDSTSEDGLYSGLIVIHSPFQGSALSPEAKISTRVNLDGNIVAKEVTIGGESHRWDLQDSANDIEEEEDKDPGGENPGPTEPEPVDRPVC